MPLIYLVPTGHDGGIRQYLSSQGRELAARMRVLSYEQLSGFRLLEPATYILSALDQLGPAMLRFVRALHEDLDARPGFRFLDHPAHTLFRRGLLDTLHRMGRNTFRALPAGGDLSGLRFPVFLRSNRAHAGAASPLLRSTAEIDEAIGRSLLRGQRLDDLLVVEFCPTADEDGVYRKYAAFRVGERIIPRHLAMGGKWMVKYDDQAVTREIAAEELQYVRTNPHRDELAEIFEIGRAEYGRIDYALSGDRIQTWEINLNPVIGQDDSPTYRAPKNALFYPAFAAALRALEGPETGGTPVPLAVDQATREAARAERVPPSRRTAPRPPPRWLDPLARPVGRWVGRLARALSAD